MENKFDLAAQNWDSNPTTIDLHTAICKELESTISWDSSWKVLDFGTGTGNLALFIAPKVSHVTAMDNSEGMLQVLQEKIINNKILNIAPECHSANTDFLSSNTYNLIISSMTFHHISDISGFIKQCYDALLPTGMLIVIDLVKEDGNFHKDFDASIFHHGFDIDELECHIKNSGFSQCNSLQFYSMYREHVKKSFPVFILQATK